jgi:hypothetical protein
MSTSAKGGGTGTTSKGPPKEKRAISRARRAAEAQMEYQEKQHRIAMLRRRIQLAQAGVHAFETGRIPEAVKNFHSYLRILEDWKGVPEGKLTPSNFDVKADVSELLLISGVYWDLTKLYDRTKSPDKQRDFMHYLEKYILFSKGMPFSGICLETMRKYISNNTPIHVTEFKTAYTQMGGDNTCFVATSLMDQCDERTLPRLRAFRDVTLSRSRAGRAFTQWYYRNGARMAAVADRLPQPARRAMGRCLDWLAGRVAGESK